MHVASSPCNALGDPLRPPPTERAPPLTHFIMDFGSFTTSTPGGGVVVRTAPEAVRSQVYGVAASGRR